MTCDSAIISYFTGAPSSNLRMIERTVRTVSARGEVEESDHEVTGPSIEHMDSSPVSVMVPACDEDALVSTFATKEAQMRARNSRVGDI